ncbi:hypothetical protein SAURM35S_02239 [Streptomyces aurantiogriseus]
MQLSLVNGQFSPRPRRSCTCRMAAFRLGARHASPATQNCRGLRHLPRPYPLRTASQTTHAVVTGEPDDRETVMSGSAGGRAEKDLSRQTPRRAADPTSWLSGYRRLSPRATNATPATTSPFSTSPQPCAATSDCSASPHRTPSKDTTVGALDHEGRCQDRLRQWGEQYRAEAGRSKPTVQLAPHSGQSAVRAAWTASVLALARRSCCQCCERHTDEQNIAVDFATGISGPPHLRHDRGPVSQSAGVASFSRGDPVFAHTSTVEARIVVGSPRAQSAPRAP